MYNNCEAEQEAQYYADMNAQYEYEASMAAQAQAQAEYEAGLQEAIYNDAVAFLTDYFGSDPTKSDNPLADDYIQLAMFIIEKTLSK
jgi:hypothetical protein